MKRRRGKLCTWGCGKPAKNKSGICTTCWLCAASLRDMADKGYAYWLTYYKRPVKDSARSQAAKLRWQRKKMSAQVDFLSQEKQQHDKPG